MKRMQSFLTDVTVSPEYIVEADSDLEGKSISEIAAMIRRDWKNVNPAASPYLNAMMQLNSIKDNYYADSGDSIVLYFLSNASGWKGEIAKKIKAHLKKLATSA